MSDCSSACQMFLCISLIVSASSNVNSLYDSECVERKASVSMARWIQRASVGVRMVQRQKWDGESAVWRAAFSDYVFAQGHVAMLPPALLFINNGEGGVIKCPSVLKPGRFSCCSANLCMSRKSQGVSHAQRGGFAHKSHCSVEIWSWKAFLRHVWASLSF